MVSHATAQLLTVEYLRTGRLRYCYERSQQAASRRDDDSPAVSFQIKRVSKHSKFFAVIFCVDADGSTLHKNFVTGDIAKEDCGFGVFTLEVQPGEDKKFYLTRACSEIRVVPKKQNNMNNSKENRFRHTPNNDPPEVRFEKREQYLQKLKKLFPKLQDICDTKQQNRGRSSSCRLAIRLIDLETGELLDAKSDVIKSCYKSFKVDSVRKVDSKVLSEEILQLTLKCDEENAVQQKLQLSMEYKKPGIREESIVGSIDEFVGKTILATFRSKSLVCEIGYSFQIFMEYAGGASESVHTPLYEVKSIDKHNNVVFHEKLPETPSSSVKVTAENAKSLEELRELLNRRNSEVHQAQIAALDNQQIQETSQLCLIDDEKGSENDYGCQLARTIVMDNDESHNSFLPVKTMAEAELNYEDCDEILDEKSVEMDDYVDFTNQELNYALKNVMDGNNFESDVSAFSDIVKGHVAVDLNDIAIDAPKNPLFPDLMCDELVLNINSGQMYAMQSTIPKSVGLECQTGYASVNFGVNRGLAFISQESFPMEMDSDLESYSSQW